MERKKMESNFDYNQEVRKCKTIDDVMGKNGLIQRLVKDVLENIRFPLNINKVVLIILGISSLSIILSKSRADRMCMP